MAGTQGLKRDDRAWDECPTPVPAFDPEALYCAQKSQLRRLARDSQTGPIRHEAVNATASALHNLAGTAAYFDEASFGMAAARLEHPLRDATSEATRRAIALEVLCLLKPDEGHS